MSLSAKKFSGAIHTGCLAAAMFTAISTHAVQPAALPERAAFLATAPLYFEAGDSQNFIARGSDCSLSLKANEAVLVSARRHSVSPFTRRDKTEPVETRTVRMTLLGANPACAMTGIEPLPGKANYLVGDNSSQWRTGVPLFGKIQASGIYPGIDLIYYADQSARLEYDFVLQPHARPEQISFRIQGADKLSIDARGDLVLQMGGEEIRQHQPMIYQNVNGVRTAVSGGYQLISPDVVSFRVGAYDRNLPLVIDPVLSFSTYLGGAKADNAWAIALDAGNNIYIAGETLTKGLGTSGVLQPTYAGGIGSFGDAFIAKYDAVSNSLVYLTYLGGKTDDGALALAVDDAGNALVTGFTDSRNFPKVPTDNSITTTTLARSGRTNNSFRIYPVNAFVSKLNPSGTALDFSILLGGNGRESGTGIALDDAGDVYVTGLTESTNFNPAPTGFQTSAGGRGDAFVVRLTGANPSLVYSTYLGGANLDYPEAIAVQKSTGDAFITGYTSSANFPTTNALTFTSGYFTNGVVLDHLNLRTNKTSNLDAFVTHLSPSGASLVYSTFLGGNGDDTGTHVAVDSAGNAYVTGYTLSHVFPTNTMVTPRSTATSYTSHVFVTKIGPAGGDSLIYSAEFGGTHSDRGTGIAVNEAAGQVYVTGFTTSSGFFATNTFADFRSTNAAAKGSAKSSNSAFITGLQESPGGAYPLTFTNSVFYGGSGNDMPNGIVVKTVGSDVVAWIAGQTTSANLVVTNLAEPALVQTRLGQEKKSKVSDAFVGKFLFPISFPEP